MAGCTCENWTLEDLSSALRDMHKDNKRIVVPMFQRGKRWKKAQEQKFIDSLIKGYPVGTMLFYETYEANKKTYILVDGLPVIVKVVVSKSYIFGGYISFLWDCWILLRAGMSCQ